MKSVCVATSLLFAACALARAQGPAAFQRQFPAGTPIEELAKAFSNGRSPAASQLIGYWKASRHVVTERFITGRAGPDRMSRGAETVSFRLRPDGGVEAFYVNVHSWILTKRNRARDLVFLSDESADVALFLSCRAVGESRLVCF